MRRLLAATSILTLAMASAAMAQSSGTGTGNAAANPPPGSAASSSPQTGTRASAETVKRAQAELKSQGLYHGAVDGIIGKETKAALSAYQKKNRLPETASLDRRTLDHLMGGEGSGSSSGKPSSPGGSGGMNPKTQR